MGILHHRETGRAGDPAVLLVHGFPESSYMWRDLMGPLADAGFHAVAPDLAAFGDTPPAPDASWEAHVARLEEFRLSLGLERVVLVTHDWGALIGLWWACEHPDAVSALVISGGGFFPDGKWHGMAKTLRTPGEGEQAIAGLGPESLGGLLAAVSTGIGEDGAREYAKAFATDEHRAAHLAMYRSGEFEKLARFDGALAGLGVPTLLLWGEHDPFAPVAGGHRFAREIPGAELVVVDGAGHFVFEDEPERCADAVLDFLRRAG